MHLFSIDSSHPPTLDDLIQKVVDNSLGDRVGIRVETDIDPSLRVPSRGDWLETLIESLLAAAIGEMPALGGELLITAVQGPRQIEIEVADNGTPLRRRFRYRPLVAAKMGARLHWSDCPQGGVAVTVIMATAASAELRVERPLRHAA